MGTTHSRKLLLHSRKFLLERAGLFPALIFKMKQKTNKKPPIYKLWISILIVISKIDTGVEPGGTFNQDQSRVDHARCNTAAD